MAKYKIVKKYSGVSREKFYVYRKYFGFWWLCTDRRGHWEQREAEAFIYSEKRREEQRLKKPETIGYY